MSAKDIDDGYTLNGYIAEVPGVCRALSFRYRPVDPITRRRYDVLRQAAVKAAKTPLDQMLAVETKNLEMVVGNVVSWDLTDHAGNPVEGAPNAESFMFHFGSDYRYARLFQIVDAGLASDARPDADPNEPQAEPAGQDTDEGNSGAA